MQTGRIKALYLELIRAIGMGRDNFVALGHRQITDRVLDLVLGPPFGGLGRFRNHGPRTRRQVALTFDDGPSRPSTEALLDLLQSIRVSATFFAVGANVEQCPDVLARAYAEGHEIGNHSMFHTRRAGLSLSDSAHIDDAAGAIRSVIGKTPRLYRPPWGWLTPWESHRLQARGYTVVGWDVYTVDWKTPEEDSIHIARKAHRDALPGSILLFHDGSGLQCPCDKTVTRQAIEHLVPALKSDGYEFVTVSQLLSVPAYASPTAPRQHNRVTTFDLCASSEYADRN